MTRQEAGSAGASGMANGKQQKKIGIMGGTFDPVHYGHLLIAQSAAEEYGLDQVVFLPTGRSPHKKSSEVTDPNIRCDMVRIAIRSNPAFVLSTLEAENPNVNYTYRTLQKLNCLDPKTEYAFIMGEDSLDDFHDWKCPDEICRLSSILVAVRNQAGLDLKEKIGKMAQLYAADMRMLHAPNFSVSSREIRERIRLGKSIRYMLPEEVEEYIRQNLLYIK